MTVGDSAVRSDLVTSAWRSLGLGPAHNATRGTDRGLAAVQARLGQCAHGDSSWAHRSRLYRSEFKAEPC